MRDELGRLASPLTPDQWAVVRWLLQRGHRAVDIAKVYPAATAAAVYSRNSRDWRVPLPRSASRGPRCPGCRRRVPVYRGALCRECHNASQRVGLRRGENHPNWQGGLTDKAQAIRTSAAYRAWRKAVFTRDDWTCQSCGARGVPLHADHVIPFALVERLRLDVDNGRTLCVPCHRATPTYGAGTATLLRKIRADHLAGA